MTNAEKINKILEVGLLALVYEEDYDHYCIVLCKDSEGLFCRTKWQSSIAECVATHIWSNPSSYFNDFIITPMQRPIEKYVNGDMVRDIQTDKIYVVKGIREHCRGFDYVLSPPGEELFNAALRHDELVPVFEEEKKPKEMTLEEVCKELGRDIKIIN